jgi:N-acetylneuraminate synthase
VPEDQKGLMRDTPWGRMTYLQYRYKVEFEKKEYDYIDNYCKEKPIKWTASVWDMGALQFLMKYDVPFIKIPSAKLVHHELVRAAAMQGKPVILSTGMSTVAEIDAAVKLLKGTDFVLMHTNSAYPAPINELNLRMIQTLKDRYNCTIGYSGHEEGLEPSVIAVALGARVIERHITLDHNMWGSDHRASLEVHAMDMLRKRIMDVDISIGDGVKRITELENAAKVKLRTGTFR